MFLLIILVLYGCYSSFDNSGIELDIPGIQNEIQAVLEKQKTLWNEGNIEGFMEYYWKSEAFTFQSGNTRLHGWQELLSRYQKSYSGENMGTLDFTDLVIKVLSRDIVYVIGRWKLIQKDTSREGLFTIIFQRMPEGWRIIHDHTS
jgi:beta-aspartyl-peptidase (threonine type)